ncbi:MAG: 2-aminoethylphosphonate--pyruvate transaminase [Verrucomicrobia bacterium]|nr:2-aminoethylphosphonate--pyruvate transaminase [Verrucomicrobiota bacterium]
MKNRAIPTAKDKTLFTPGPLTTSLNVKQAMLRDAGSWHFEFNEIVAQIREDLLDLAGVAKADGYTTVLMQGSGSFGVESVIGSVVPPDGKLLIVANGAYGDRMVKMAERLRLRHRVLRFPENVTPDPSEIDRLLLEDPEVSDVAGVHCETSTGIENPITEIGRVVKARGKIYIVDAMSSFGALPIPLKNSGIDYLISSANKCIEGVPGFSFVIARRDALVATEGSARSLSLDLLAQLKGFETNGQFRFTPPTHSILAFEQAMRELDDEGGITARCERYRRIHKVLVSGMRRMGFRTYLPEEVQSCIITSFYYPSDSKFSFPEFYQKLSEKGFIIYPGKISQADLFRIGSIGRIFESDIRSLLAAIQETVLEMELCLEEHSFEPSLAAK